MSINVTVNGNPVNIKRGKMVTSDPNYQQKEQQKRRRIRLEQVRQQSKEIAESVRNKVKKERSKQLSNFEQENATKLKEWQNRKLLDLQSQYRECLKDIGLGHTQALIEETEEIEFLEKKEKEIKGKARERGIAAKEKLQIENNERSLKEARPKQIKKMVRDVENVRSKMIADLAKNKNKDDDLVEVLSEDEFDEGGKFVREQENMHFPSPDESRTSSPGMPRQSFPIRGEVEVYKTQFENKLPHRQVKKNLKGRNVSQSDDRFELLNQDKKGYNKTSSDCRVECLKDFDKLKSPTRKRTKSPKLLAKNRKTPKKVPQDFSDENFEFSESFPDKSKKFVNDNCFESEDDFNSKQKNRRFSAQIDDFIETEISRRSQGKSPKSRRFSVEEDVEDEEYLVDIEDYDRSPNRKKSKSPKSRREQSDTSFTKKTLKFDEENQSVSRATMTEDPPVNFPLDTRISDRIKSRRLPSIATNETLITMNSGDMKNFACQTEIPTKPKVCIKPTSSSQCSQSFSKIKSYDHENRFSSDLIVDCNVQKISEDSIEVCVDNNEDVSYNKMKFKREVEAGKRGRLALEKARIQKDYDDLMQKLPVLQKQERLAAIDHNKDKFHMSEERKKEVEKLRQKKIENVFEEMIGNVITIPKKVQIEDEEFNDKDCGDCRNEKCKNHKNVEESLGCWKNEIEPSDSLQNLLEKLRIQKELLLKETETQPCQLSKCVSKESTSTRSTSSSDKPQFVSASTSPIKKHKDKKNVMKNSPCKYRSRSRKDVLILQNMSTQTSPKTSVCPAPTKESKKEVCDCAESSEKLCEILIKFQENDKPEIVVKSPEKMKETGVVIALENEDGKKMEKVLLNDEKKGDEKSFSGVVDKEKKVCAVQEREKKDCSGRDTKVCVEKNVLEEKKRSGKKIEISRDKNILQRKNLERSGYNSSNVRSTRPQDSSWSQNFSKNDFTTSSTSYFSPPDYTRQQSLLKNQQKQTNVSNKTIDPRLLTYIKKLLTMSRNNLDNLSVSAVSEVSTPSSSIINSESNNPTGKLLNVLKFFNLDLNDVMQNLSKSGNNSERTSSSGYNASHSGINETNPNFGSKQNLAKNEEKNQINLSELDQTDYISFKRDNLEKSKGVSQSSCRLQESQNSKNQTVDARSLNLDSYVDNNYPDVLAAHYSNLADKCQQKISDITAKLLKVREEKSELLSPNNSSDKENATSYLNLPSQLGEDSSSNKSSSPEQRELTKKLLTVDIHSLSNKLIENSGPREFNTDIDKDIIERYLKLLDEKPTNEFVPMLLDIPKLPKLSEKLEITTKVDVRKKPPPTKLAANNQLNFMPHELSTIVEGDSLRKSKSPEKVGPIKLSISPAGQEMRELGVERLEKTSVEELDLVGKDVRILKAEESANTLISGFINQIRPNVNFDKDNIIVKEGKLVKKFDVSKEHSSDTSEDINAEMTPSSINSSSSKVIAAQKITLTPRSPTKSPQPGPSYCKTNSCSKRNTNYPLQQILKKLQDVSTDTSSDKSEVDIEVMLKNMGMGWAVATYRKTQEALAQESSTSSLDTSKKKNISSSTSKSDNTISPFFKELQDISAIQGSGVSNDRQHRTSTPVQTTRSSDKNLSDQSGKMFSGESDLSSVKGKRDSDIVFVSMPNDTGSSTSTTT